MATDTVRFDERALLNEMRVTLQIVRSRSHRRMLPAGVWLMRLGARIAGFGEFVVDERDAPHDGEAAD